MNDVLYNIAFERSILSSIIFEPRDLTDLILKSSDFYLPAHQNIYEAMLFLQKKEKPIDEEFIKKILVSQSKFDEQILLEVMAANPIADLTEYIKEVKNNSFKRNFGLKINQLKTTIPESNSSQMVQELEQTLELLKNDNPSSLLLNIESTKNIEVKLPEFYLEKKLPIQKNEITIISAKGGSGKSYLGLLILSLLKKDHNLKVFGYFSEDDKGITKNRLNKLNEIHKFNIDIDILGKETRPLPFIKYDRNRNLTVTDYFYEFKQQLKNYDAILIDPLIAFIADDENSNTEARFFMNLLNEWCEKENKTLILIHHHAKGEGGGIRGAGAFVDAVRLHYAINKPTTIVDGKEEVEDNSPYRIVNLMKTNHYTGPNEFKIQLFKMNFETITYQQPQPIKPKIEMPSL